MNPQKVNRACVSKLTDLPNIGKAIAGDLLRIGIDRPEKLKGKSAYAMYNELCRVTGKKHDPCMIDVFLSITDFMNGGEPKEWWKYTAQRKQQTALLIGAQQF